MIDPQEFLREGLAFAYTAVTASKDEAPAVVQAAMANVAGWDLNFAGGGLIPITLASSKKRIALLHQVRL